MRHDNLKKMAVSSSYMNSGVCATVLATKPYSGYYHCCVHCMGKLRETEDRTAGNGVRSFYWCRRCSQQYNDCDVTQRYCVAMTVSDHTSTISTEVVMFGKTLNTLFGLPATQLHQYLRQRYSHEMEVSDHINQALRYILVGKCVLLSFPKQAVTTGGAPVTLATLRTRSSSTQIIANGVRVLGNHQQCSVLSFLENSLLGSEERDNKLAARCVLASQTSNTSSFFGDSQPTDSGSCVSSSATFHLETFCEQTTVSQSPSSIQHPTTASRVLPTSQHQGLLLGQKHSQVNSSTPQQSPVDIKKPHQPDDNSTPLPVTSFSSVDCSFNETILHELTADWESSQHGGQLVMSSDVSLAESELQFSEDVLRELQLNFDPSPACTQLKSQHSSYQLASPDLFSTSSSCTPISHFESPEMFGSQSQQQSTHQLLPSQERSFNHDILTPSIQRTRHRLVKRTLLQKTPSSTPLHPLTTTSGVYSTPHEQVSTRSSFSSTPNNYFTPDLL